MKIFLNFLEPDYGQLLMSALPLMAEKLTDDGSFRAQLAKTALDLPHEDIVSLLDNLPQWKIDRLLSGAVTEYEDKLVALANSLLRRYDVALCVDGISLTPCLECTISLSDIDYLALARRFLPMVSAAVLKEGPATEFLSPLIKLPSKLLYATLEKMSQEKKEQAVVQLVSKCDSLITKKLDALARSKGFELPPFAIWAEV